MALSQKLRVPFELEVGSSYRSVATDRVDDAPAIRAFDEILDSALAQRATDVHIEPLAQGGRVRQRVDGVLHESQRLSPDLFGRVLSRAKLLSGMDIADRRLPQDGRYAARRRGRAIEARISSMPTIAGETLAIRLLEHEAAIPTLEALGMPAAMAVRYRKFIHAPSGFVIVCGPTGSGKTTTLYASMAERNVVAEHICSIEDPVEIRLPGVAQLQVNNRAGLTFATALRAFLRQDPNVIMIGELRDAETASVATSAALCGQLVLTTIHSSDALSALERLVELGSTRRYVAAAVSGVVSQRLVRQLCPDCKVSAPATAAATAFGISGEETIAAPVGCERCSATGYWGRSAIFEMATMSPGLQNAIESGASAGERLAAAREAGYTPLVADAARLIRSGETSVAEVIRVLAVCGDQS